MKTEERYKRSSNTSLSEHDKKWIRYLRDKRLSIDKISFHFNYKSNRTAIYLYLKSLPGYKPLNRKVGP